MKLSDYLAESLKKNGIKHVFQVIGGASVHMVHSLASTPGIDYVCVQHEQAGAMAAESYSRITGNLGCAMATSGPGMTNLITGIGCAYFDSTPVVYITGQVNTFESKQGRKVRQVGFQETDIVDIVKPLTKYAVQIQDPNDIEYYLSKAIYLAKSGRPGPVLIDIPLDVQRAEINSSKLKKFNPKEIEIGTDSSIEMEQKISEAIIELSKAERPVLVAGGAIRYAELTDQFKKLVSILKIPVVATWSGIDTLDHGQPYYIGQIGVYGSRAANFAVQNSDCMIGLGTRLDTRITGGKPETFARAAKKIVVDIDKAELYKKRGLTPDIGICSDVKDFMPMFISKLEKSRLFDGKRSRYDEWLQKAKKWKKSYPVYVAPKKHQRTTWVDQYLFIDTLAKNLGKNAVIIPDCGGNLTFTIQGFQIKDGQRLYSSMGNSPMGYSVPAGIGALLANKKKTVVSIIGDGGFQMNIQELQTLKHYNLPLKVFILNSRSYGIITQFQKQYFEGKYIATVPKSGYSFPNFIKVAKAYGLKTVQIKSNHELQTKIKSVLSTKGPVICDVQIPQFPQMATKTSFGKPIEDLAPELPRDEFSKNMVIPTL